MEQKEPLLLLPLEADFVELPKNEIFSATLRASSIAATVSALGLLAGLFSAMAAMAVRAAVALIPMVALLIKGTLPMSRLKTAVDFSALLTRSLNLCKLGVTEGEGEWSLLPDAARLRGTADLLSLAGAQSRGWSGLLGGNSLFLDLGMVPSERICDGGSASLSTSDSDTMVSDSVELSATATALRRASVTILLFSF